MKIAKNTVVVIDYVLKNDEGQVLHSSEDGKLLSYLHGTDGIIPGLERELDGKQVGDQLQVAVAAKDGYGERDKALNQTAASVRLLTPSLAITWWIWSLTVCSDNPSRLAISLFCLPSATQDRTCASRVVRRILPAFDVRC